MILSKLPPCPDFRGIRFDFGGLKILDLAGQKTDRAGFFEFHNLDTDMWSRKNSLATYPPYKQL
jgi:hypothetical protein